MLDGVAKMPLDISVETLSNLQVVSLRGRLDSAGTPALESSMNELIAAGGKRVVIDCSELRYVSSVGLGVFVSSAKALEANGGRLSFAALNQHVKSVFEMVGFSAIFVIHHSAEEAVAEG